MHREIGASTFWCIGMALALLVGASPVLAQGGAGAKDRSAALPPCAPEPLNAGDVPPCLVKRVDPVYSDKARAEKVQGDVLLDIQVTPEGKVGSVIVFQSLDTRFGLDQRAIAAVRQWEYRPARRNGQPVQRPIQVTIPFRLVGVPPAPRPTPVEDVIPADVRRPGGPGLTVPRLKRQVSPVYTASAMRARVTGTVIVEVVVQADGTVGAARVIRSLDRERGLDDQALGAAREWLFEPASLDGRPVATLVRLELEFKLH